MIPCSAPLIAPVAQAGNRDPSGCAREPRDRRLEDPTNEEKKQIQALLTQLDDESLIANSDAEKMIADKAYDSATRQRQLAKVLGQIETLRQQTDFHAGHQDGSKLT